MAAPLDWDALAQSVAPANAEPLHAQIASVVRARIEDGSWPPGTALPTEAEFQERFHVSRSVVRQALAGLTADGLIARGRGRASVVVQRRELHRVVQRMAGLSTQFEDRGVHVATEILSFARVREPHAESELRTARVLAIRRLRSAGNEPIALIHTWLPMSQVTGLTAADLIDASLHGVLRRRYGISIITGTRQIKAVAASEEIAAALRVPAGSPLLLLQGTSRDEQGHPIEVFSTWHRADRVVFDIDVVRDQGVSLLAARGTGSASPPSDPASDIRPTAPVPSPSPDAPALADVARRLDLLIPDLRELVRTLDALGVQAGHVDGHDDSTSTSTHPARKGRR